MSYSNRFHARKSIYTRDFGIVYRNPTGQKLGDDASFFTKIPDCVALDSNLTDREFRVLSTLHMLWRIHGSNPVPLNITSLAEHIHKSRRSTSEIISSLEEKGYVSRATDTENHNCLVLFFKSFSTLYGEKTEDTIKIERFGALGATRKLARDRRNDFRTPKSATRNDKNRGECSDSVTAGGRKPSRGLGGSPHTSDNPDKIDLKPDKTSSESERHGFSAARARQEDKEERRGEDSSLRSESDSLRSSSSGSLRSPSVSYPDRDVTPPSAAEIEGTSPSPLTSPTPLPVRKLPPKKKASALSVDAEPEGGQVELFKEASSKKSPPNTSARRDKGEVVKASKTAKRTKKPRKTPEGGTTPGQVVSIFNKALASRYPNAPISKKVDRMDIGQIFQKVSGYSPDVVEKMVNVLFDDWSALKEKVWPKPTEAHPVLSHVWMHYKTLVSHIDQGVTDGSARVSQHALRTKGAEEAYKAPGDLKAYYRERFGHEAG